MLLVEKNTGSGLPERIVSLDVFRGITIAAMILVDHPGSWDEVCSPMSLHSSFGSLLYSYEQLKFPQSPCNQKHEKYKRDRKY